jgi:hypothetical protein
MSKCSHSLTHTQFPTAPSSNHLLQTLLARKKLYQLEALADAGPVDSGERSATRIILHVTHVSV